MRTGAAHGRSGHVHEAGFYSSDAEFLALIVPFVTGGIAAGEPVVIGYDDRKCDLLRAELARPDMVSFIADARLYATPAGAIEAYRQQFERHVAAGVEQIRIAGDVPHEGNGGRFDGWDRYESAVNVVWQDYPVYSRCLYDATTVADRVRDVVQRTHRRLLTADGGATASSRYQEVADFERLPTADDPLEATPPTVTLINASPRKARHWVGEAAQGRVDAATLQELLFGVSEAVLNAHLHGRRPVTVTGWTGPDRVVVRVHDNGPGPADPLTGLMPAPGGTDGPGLGLWITHQFTNIDIALLAGTDGFTVRLRGGQQTRPAAMTSVPGTTSSSSCPGNDETGDLVGVGERAGRLSTRPALEQPMTALEQSRPADGPPADFRRGARAALRWLPAGGPAPLTETVTGQPPPSTTVVPELAAAEALIDQWRVEEIERLGLFRLRGANRISDLSVPLQEVAITAAARIVTDARAGVVLTRGGAALPLPGFGGHPLLAAGSPVLVAAAQHLADGSTHASFLCPCRRQRSLERHARVTVLACRSQPALQLAAAVLLSAPGDLCALSDRELEILGRLIEGSSYHRIAAGLGLSEHAMAADLGDIRFKLEASTRTLAVLRAARLGLYVPSALAALRWADATATVHRQSAAGPAAKPFAMGLPAALNRAVEAIEAHPEHGFTTRDIAEIAHVSPRTLQQAFRQHMGISPMGYLREVRLARAHDDLRRARPDETTVARIANKWGFTSHGRFATAYRARFGIHPAGTLRDRERQ